MSGAKATDAELHTLPAEVRREVVAPTEALVPAAPVPPNAAPSTVRVLGHIFRAGRPLAGYDLSFLILAPGRDLEECDWDFTGEDGRYEVYLSAARYVVRNEDGAEVAEMVVPGSREELVLDIELGPAR